MTGGGTAGHINPAIAIANTIKENIPDAEIAFVGTKHGLENKLVPKEGYPLYHVEVMGFARSLTLKNIKAAYLALVSPIRAKKLVKEFKPDIVIGTGGYACWPVLKAASALGVPTAVHESNAIPGLAIRKLQGCVDRIFVNFRQTEKYIDAKEKVMYVGNPLRTGFENITYEKAREELRIKKNQKIVLSFGGSLGAHKINEAVFNFMNSYAKEHQNVLIFHATGNYDFKEFSEKFRDMGLEKYPNLRLMEYIHDMPLRMSAADVVICRAGAMTISELAMMKKACIMIPSPNVVDDHQYKNAKVLADAGAAVLLEEAYMNDEIFFEAVEELIKDNAKRRSLCENIAQFANADANRLIFDEISKLAVKK